MLASAARLAWTCDTQFQSFLWNNEENKKNAPAFGGFTSGRRVFAFWRPRELDAGVISTGSFTMVRDAGHSVYRGTRALPQYVGSCGYRPDAFARDLRSAVQAAVATYAGFATGAAAISAGHESERGHSQFVPAAWARALNGEASIRRPRRPRGPRRRAGGFRRTSSGRSSSAAGRPAHKPIRQRARRCE